MPVKVFVAKFDNITIITAAMRQTGNGVKERHAGTLTIELSRRSIMIMRLTMKTGRSTGIQKLASYF